MSRLRCIPQIYHANAGATVATTLRCPVIIGMMKIVERVLVAAAMWSVLWCSHSSIPFAIHVCLVSCAQHVLCHTSHIPWNGCIARYRIFRIVNRGRQIERVHMDRIPSTLHCRSCWAAEFVNIMAIKLHTLLDK